MKHIKLFEQFITEKKDEKYIAYVDDKRKPGGSDKEIKKDYNLDVEGRTSSGFSIIGTKEDIEAFIDDYGIILDDEIQIYEATVHTISGNSGRTITILDDKKYELKKEVKDARIGNYVNVVLPKGTIITNLPGGIFANHEDLKTKYCTGYKAERWLDKHGVMIRQMPETIHEIEKNGKVLESLNEATETAINQLAKDEQAEGYDAKVFLGKFDGQTFKAQSTDKTWQDGVPVMKNFSRNGFKPVSLKGEYQLVDSDRGWWYIQGPKNTWYAVKHVDYGTPPFEY